MYQDTWLVLYLFPVAVLVLAEVIWEVTSGNPPPTPSTALCLSCSVTETAVSPSKTRCVEIVLG